MSWILIAAYVVLPIAAYGAILVLIRRRPTGNGDRALARLLRDRGAALVVATYLAAVLVAAVAIVVSG